MFINRVEKLFIKIYVNLGIQTREKLSITNKGKPWTEARRLAQNKRGNK